MCLFSSQRNAILILTSFCLTKFYLLLFFPVRVVHYWGFLRFIFSAGKPRVEEMRVSIRLAYLIIYLIVIFIHYQMVLKNTHYMYIYNSITLEGF